MKSPILLRLSLPGDRIWLMTSEHPSGNPPVHLVGGPADWHGKTMTINTREELAGPRDRLGTYLISNGVPAGHPDPGARAVYEPNLDPWPPHLWFFRGWVPVAPDSAEVREPAVEHDLEVRTDENGLPTELRHQGEEVRIVRVLAHWQGEDEHQDPAVWHVLTRDGDWHLNHHPGSRWTGGPLPAVEQQPVAPEWSTEEWD